MHYLNLNDMKKTFYTLLFGGILILSTTAYGQVSQAQFSPSNSNQISLAEQNGIKTLYQPGTIGLRPAICLDFKNTSTKEIVFNWTLKDANGQKVYSGNTIKLEAGQSLDEKNNPVLKNRMTFILNNGMKAADYKTEITIKN